MDRRVIRSRKDPDGGITALCNPGAEWSPRNKQDAIRDIESRDHGYYVDRAGYRIDVQVVQGPNGKYLRTTGDPASANNLENLDDC